jgi:hypothetical protein
MSSSAEVSMTVDEDVERLLGSHAPEIAATARALRSAIRDAAPEYVEHVDFGNKLIAFGRTMQMRDLAFAVIPHTAHVNLQLADGVDLPDPDGLGRGDREADPPRQGALRGRGGFAADPGGHRGPGRGPPMMSGVAAVSWGAGRIDLFWRDFDGALIHRAFDGSAWADAESLGGTLASDPAATAWAVDELQVFAIFPDGELWNRYWDGANWHAWESLGGELDGDAGTPAASSWAADRIDVWGRGRDGRIWHRWWDGDRWIDWEQLDRPAAGSG